MLTVSIKNNSPLHHSLTRGIERFGKNYRYRHEGNWFRIVDIFRDEIGYFKIKIDLI